MDSKCPRVLRTIVSFTFVVHLLNCVYAHNFLHGTAPVKNEKEASESVGAVGATFVVIYNMSHISLMTCSEGREERQGRGDSGEEGMPTATTPIRISKWKREKYHATSRRANIPSLRLIH